MQLAEGRLPDGTSSLVTTVSALEGLELVAGQQDGRRTRTLRDAQHAYVLGEI